MKANLWHRIEVNTVRRMQIRIPLGRLAWSEIRENEDKYLEIARMEAENLVEKLTKAGVVVVSAKYRIMSLDREEWKPVPYPYKSRKAVAIEIEYVDCQRGEK